MLKIMVYHIQVKTLVLLAKKDIIEMIFSLFRNFKIKNFVFYLNTNRNFFNS
jgi:hypothetical protein